MLSLIATAIAFVVVIVSPMPTTIKLVVSTILVVYFVTKLIGDYLIDIIHNRKQNNVINLLQAEFPNAEIFLFTEIGSNPKYTHHPSKKKPTNEYIFASTPDTPLAEDDNYLDTIKKLIDPTAYAIMRIGDKRTLNPHYLKTIAYVKKGKIETKAIA